MKIKFLLPLLSLLLIAAVPTALPRGDLVEYAQTNFPQKGKLQQASSGMVYVKVSDGYIHTIFPMIKEKNLTLPPYFSGNNVGAHITVITAKEMKQIHSPIQGLGKEISFKVTNFSSVQPENWKGISKVYYFEVESKELETVRTSAGLPPKILDHDFHITVALEN